MRIMHVTDIHGGIKQLADAVRFANQEGLEVLACTGDLIGYYSNEQITQAMRNAAGYVENKFKPEKPITLDEAVKRIIGGETQGDDNLSKAAAVYSKIEEAFNNNANQQYREIQDIFKEFNGRVLSIRGNWDPLNYYDQLDSKFRLGDGATEEVGGLLFQAYGGAPGVPVFMPPTKADYFNEQHFFHTLISSEEQPDVLLMHVPAWGFQDRSPNQDGTFSRIGSFAARSYMVERRPDLVLHGHAHDDRGISKIKNRTNPKLIDIAIVNPGNLGPYRGSGAHGTFAVISLDEENGVRQIDLYAGAGSDINLRLSEKIN